MNVALWIAQGLMAAVFLAAGIMHATQSRETQLERGLDWVEDFSPEIVRVIGVLELLGALGLILPALTGILPILTPLAAAGLTLTMIGGALTHIRRSEGMGVLVTVVLGLIVAFIAYGRFAIAPLA